MSKRQKGRKSKGRFAMQPEQALEHEAVTTLHHAHFRVLVLLTKQYSGYNNGALGLSKSQAAEHGIANRTLYRALRELERRFLIEMTYPASRVPPRPTMYAITWWPKDDTHYCDKTRVPSRAYREWQSRPRLKVVSGGRSN